MAKFVLKYREFEYKAEETDTIRIGRSPESNIQLEDMRVSENHCEIMWNPDIGARIRDLGSTNGTIILRNKKRILVGRRPDSVKREDANTVISDAVPLLSGDKVRLYSDCIMDVEYFINATQREMESFFNVADSEEIHKAGDAQKAKEIVNPKDDYKSDEPYKAEENSESRNAYDTKEVLTFEHIPTFEQDCNAEEDGKRTKETQEYNEDHKEIVPPRVSNEGSVSVVVKLDATVKENIADDFETEWATPLFSQLKERYRLERLHFSRFTELWKATPQKWGSEEETCVIKILTLDKNANSETAELLFEREKKIAPQLNHPNIVKTFRVGRSGNQHYIVMEYCKHNNLADFLKEKSLQNMSEKMAIRIIIQMLKGLNYYHNPPFIIEYDDKYRRTLKDGARKLVHRDIKPMNVLVRSVDSTGNPEIVICDFGLAKDTSMGGSSGITSDRNEVRATLAFAPCDQVQNPALVNTGVDIWSTFAVLFWLLTGETPRDMSGCLFDQIEDYRQLANVKEYFKHTHVRKIHSIRSDVSPELAKIVDDVLSTDQDIHEYSNEEEISLINKLESML